MSKTLYADRVHLRLTPAEKLKLSAAAEAEGVKLSEYMRLHLQRAAQTTMARRGPTSMLGRPTSLLAGPGSSVGR